MKRAFQRTQKCLFQIGLNEEKHPTNPVMFSSNRPNGYSNVVQIGLMVKVLFSSSRPNGYSNVVQIGQCENEA